MGPLVVLYVQPDSLVFRKGMRAGDIIVKINGEQSHAHEFSYWQEFIRQNIGKKEIHLSINRYKDVRISLLLEKDNSNLMFSPEKDSP